jgi:hypothetical protein
MSDTRNQLNRIMPAILAALSDQRRPDRPIKVAFAPNGHIEAIVTVCDDGPVVLIQNETAAREERHDSKFRRKANRSVPSKAQSANAAGKAPGERSSRTGSRKGGAG